jgi:hypothetical protein
VIWSVTVLPATELDSRGRRLRTALAAVLVPDNAPELRLVREWLNNWSGIGLVVVGMAWQGWDLQLTAYEARSWRANFFPVGIAHSIGGSGGSRCRGGRCSGRRGRRSGQPSDNAMMMRRRALAGVASDSQTPPDVADAHYGKLHSDRPALQG